MATHETLNSQPVYPANGKYHRLQAHQTTFSSAAAAVPSALTDKPGLTVQSHLQFRDGIEAKLLVSRTASATDRRSQKLALTRRCRLCRLRWAHDGPRISAAPATCAPSRFRWPPELASRPDAYGVAV
jgi:hypothetical protein